MELATNSAVVTFSFRTRALLGFLPKSLELTPNQFILHLGFGTNLPWFRVPSIFSSLVRSRATVLLGHASNALYEPISRYGKLEFLVSSRVGLCLHWLLLVWLNPSREMCIRDRKISGLPLNSAVVTFSFRPRALLGFLPTSLELAPNQFILHLGFGTNLPWFRVPSIFSSLVRSRAAVLLGHASNALYEPLSRYGKFEFLVSSGVGLWLHWLLLCAVWVFIDPWMIVIGLGVNCPRLMGGVDQRHGFDICVYEDFISGRVNSLESLGETFGVALQWSGRNSMAPGPVSLTQSELTPVLGGEQLGGEQRYPPQVQASAESD
ncbi:hypothetical protein DEO72_LG5g1268 [Vigna unguiculata]|uniref:Uncharacterized protein n=1 Tax=Vigna unguiculata TaxID=3917 RepID=A0A4D6LZ09_VIGUN|nr:hypothetical protein DEO72_LG5g1268 [Vigna unguiculata]